MKRLILAALAALALSIAGCGGGTQPDAKKPGDPGAGGGGNPCGVEEGANPCGGGEDNPCGDNPCAGDGAVPDDDLDSEGSEEEDTGE